MADLQAIVVSVKPSAESPLFAVVSVRFTNAGSAAMRITRYRICWPGGTATFRPRDLLLEPGEGVVRSSRIDPSCGALKSLMRQPAAAVVDVLATTRRR